MTKISDRVRIMIENEKVTINKFSQILGYERSQTIHDILNSKSNPSFDFFYKFAKSEYSEYYNLYWLIAGEGEMMKSKVQGECTSPSSSKPQLAEIQSKDSENNAMYSEKGIPLIPIEALAGLPVSDNTGITFVDCEHYVIPEFKKKGVEFMIRVSGSSMYPKYSNGDILACRRIHDILFFQWGKVYVIDSSQGALVKRVFKDESPDNILLVSDNMKKYPPFNFPKSDIRSLSIVLGVIRLE